MPGRTRHHETFFPCKQLRTIFILANKIPQYFEHDRFKSRFITIDLTNWDPIERIAASMPDWKEPAYSPPRTIVLQPESPYEPELMNDLPYPDTPAGVFVPEAEEYQDGDEEREECTRSREAAAARALADARNLSSRMARAKKHPKSIASDDEYEYAESQDPYE